MRYFHKNFKKVKESDVKRFLSNAKKLVSQRGYSLLNGLCDAYNNATSKQCIKFGNQWYIEIK